ncbi:hypothetical protein FHR71_003686 [Methylobacterium sp. RAS18]|nr:hypothetical protein [Methylobacterium sp. RAS18]
MTDAATTNVISLAERRRKPDYGPPSIVDLRTYAIKSEVPGAPVLVVLEYRGEHVGCLGTFPDTPEGHAMAKVAGTSAINAMDLMTKFYPSSGA